MDRGWLPVPDPVALKIGNFEIMWYAVMLTLATVAGLIICYHRAPKKGLNQDRFLDLFLWCAPAGIIGARAYYVIFEWDYYSKHLNQILKSKLLRIVQNRLTVDLCCCNKEKSRKEELNHN